jgi:membrane-associated phospholipid phosphatase
MHYPSDILAGLILGSVYGITAVCLSKVAVKKFEEKAD